MAPFTMTSFGPAKASKRALLLCGSVQMGYCWWKIAEYLVDQGYRVDCPDIQPNVPSHEAKVQTEYLLKQIEIPKQGYELLGGINLGSLMSLELLKHLEIAPRRVVLIEPPIDAKRPEGVNTFLAGLEKVYQDTDEKSLRELVNKPGVGHRIDWTAKRLAILRNGPQSVGKNAMANLVDHSVLPSSKGPTEIIILASDPAGRTFYNIDEKASYMAANYPHVRLVVATGIGHDLLMDAPELTANVLLADDLTKVKEVRVVQ